MILGIEGTYKFSREVRFPKESINGPVKELEDRFLNIEKVIYDEIVRGSS